MKKVSLKDIARQAGVAPSTVSGVINGKAKQRRISDEVARRIEALAKQEGYRPNQTAVSLRTGQSKIIGLIVEDISNAFFSTLARTVEDKLYSLGYRIVYCSTENDDRKGNELVSMLLHQQVDGFLITPSKGMDSQIAELVALDVPVVLMDRCFPHVAAPSVMVHNYGAVRNAVNYLFEKGYWQIGFVTVDLDQIQMHERKEGYLGALKEKGVRNVRQLVLKLPYEQSKEKDIQAIMGFVKRHPGLDALFFATNYLGICGLESIGRLKLSIPEDIAVVCFDDHDIFRIFNPGITIIEQPIGAIANTAVEILMGRIDMVLHGKSAAAGEYRVVMDTTLVVRGST